MQKLLNGHVIRKRQIFAAPSRPTRELYDKTTVYVTGIVQGFDVQNFFNTTCGEVVAVREMAENPSQMEVDEEGGGGGGGGGNSN